MAKGEIVAVVEGRTRALLSAERTALNFLQRLSGVATLTRRFVDAVAGTRARIVDTRKTTPGWRALDKDAVRAGGGGNHRVDLAAGVLIKDNHVAACGGVKVAVERARARAPHSLRVEVEVTELAQIEEALAAGADIILLDNFDPPKVAQAVKQIAGRALIEVSGGINLDTVREFAEAGPDLDLRRCADPLGARRRSLARGLGAWIPTSGCSRCCGPTSSSRAKRSRARSASRARRWPSASASCASAASTSRRRRGAAIGSMRCPMRSAPTSWRRG